MRGHRWKQRAGAAALAAAALAAGCSGSSDPIAALAGKSGRCEGRAEAGWLETGTGFEFEVDNDATILDATTFEGVKVRWRLERDGDTFKLTSGSGDDAVYVGGKTSTDDGELKITAWETEPDGTRLEGEEHGEIVFTVAADDVEAGTFTTYTDDASMECTAS